jgi:hypothetical protein
MGFPLIDRAAMEAGRVCQGNIRDETAYSREPGNPHLVEANLKIGMFYGNKFLLAAIILRCSSRPGWYNLLKTNHRSSNRRQLARNLGSRIRLHREC